MKRISKADEKRRDELVDKLTVCGNVLEAAIQTFNAAQTEAYKPVAVAVEQYNDLIREAEGFCSDIAGEIESYIDERSDVWREGDKGSAYSEWLSAWQDPPAEIDIEEPQEIDSPEMGGAESLRDLESEAAL